MNSSDALTTLGVPGLAFVVVILASVVVFLYRKLDAVQTKHDTAQEQRIADAKEFGNKIAEPLESLRIMTEREANMIEKMYEILLDSRGK